MTFWGEIFSPMSFDYGLLVQEMNEASLLGQLAIQLSVREQVSASMEHPWSCEIATLSAAVAPPYDE